MNALKSIGSTLLFIGIWVAVLFVLWLLFTGAGWASAHLLPWFSLGSIIAGGVLFLILLPLSAFRGTRPFAVIAIYIVSYIFGITVWMEGLLVTLSTWGILAAIIGLLIMGIGIVPIAILSALFHGMWSPMIEMIVLTGLTFGCRFYSLWLAELTDRNAPQVIDPLPTDGFYPTSADDL